MHHVILDAKQDILLFLSCKEPTRVFLNNGCSIDECVFLIARAVFLCKAHHTFKIDIHSSTPNLYLPFGHSFSRSDHHSVSSVR